MNKSLEHDPSCSSNRYRNFTPAQKWAETVKLREMAWNLKCAAIKANHPDWDEKQVHIAVRDIFLYAST